jgi:hypothetical protein
MLMALRLWAAESEGESYCARNIMITAAEMDSDGRVLINFTLFIDIMLII